MQRPPLTDRAALARHRARSDPGALFAHAIARASVEERLSEVNRTFTRPAVITGHPGAWGDSTPTNGWWRTMGPWPWSAARTTS